MSQLRLENAALRIRIAALEDALVKWQQLHEGSVEAWRAALTQQRQALMNIHAAVVRDHVAPEDDALDWAVIQ